MKHLQTVTRFVVLLIIFSCDAQKVEMNGGPSDSGPDTDSQTETDTDSETDSDTGTEFAYDWDQAVDEAWGEAPDLETRRELFEAVWQGLADDYACFETFGIDWDEKHDELLPQVENATSYGRFAQALMQLSWVLQDPHTYVRSNKVCRGQIRERPPIDLTGVSAYSTVLGACVTATEEDELVVYRVDIASNVLNLEIGDEIIGYDGKTWSENMEMIAGARLPACGRVSAVAEAYEYSRLSSVLMNSHLFSTLEIKRVDTGEVESVNLADVYETILPNVEPSEIVCNSQLPIEGIAFPPTELSALEQANALSWGILPGTNIGYIYAYRWLDGDVVDFELAVQELWETDALIIDQRLNLGGRYSLVYYGLPSLFGEDTPAVDYYVRDKSSDDYTTLELWFSTAVEADPETFYDKPIALLIGPDAMSGGDLFPYVMAKHPRVRLFGKPTAGGFGGIMVPFDPDPFISDITFMITDSIMLEPTTGDRLEAYENVPDTHIWLNKDDIIAGVDTVVESALEWIDQEL